MRCHFACDPTQPDLNHGYTRIVQTMTLALQKSV
jgi:hypothetical protein